MLLQIVVFLGVLSILVLIHEFGHFIVGRWAKIGIIEFALGLPFTKPLLSKKLKGGMKVSLYPVLFGGFVNLLGEDHSASENPENVPGLHFYQVNVWKRFLVVAAGVTMNLLLAVIVFYVFLAQSNFKNLIPKFTDYQFVSPSSSYILVTKVASQSPGESGGLRELDLIKSVDGQTFENFEEFQQRIQQKAGTLTTLEVTNLDLTTRKMVSFIPRQNPPEGQGAIGIGIGEMALVQFNSPAEKLFSGVVYTYDMGIYNLKLIQHFVSQSLEKRDITPVSETISGPIGIFVTVGDVVNLGGDNAVKGIINLLAIMSLSLAIMNVLPFPALDGGKLVLLVIEGLTGKKLSPAKENWVNQAGMAFLMGLIVLISYNDILKVVQRL